MVEFFKVLFELEGLGTNFSSLDEVSGAMALVNSKRDLPLSLNCHCDCGEWGVRFECGDVYWLVVPCLAFQESVYLSFSRFFLDFSLLSTIEIAWYAKFVLCCWSSRLKISTVPVVKFH